MPESRNPGSCRRSPKVERRRSEGGTGRGQKVERRAVGGQTADGRWHRPTNFGHLNGDLLDVSNCKLPSARVRLRDLARKGRLGVALESLRSPASALRPHKCRFGVGSQRPTSGISTWIVRA
jgi:hypothetical protein